MQVPQLIDRVRTAAKGGVAAVAQELALDGAAFDRDLHSKLTSNFSAYPNGSPLFYKCIVESTVWAGFAQGDSAWRSNGMQFLQTGAPHIKMQYKRGFHGRSNPIANLETWDKLLGEPSVPVPPDHKSSAHDIVRFYQNAFAALKKLDWRRDRSWLGPWTFHGVFKIYLLHEDRLWNNPAIDAIILPMGGADGEYSFENGWEILENLGIVSSLPSGEHFDDKMAAAAQAHATIQRLAGLSSTRALHVNSGVYLLGSS